MSTPNPALVAAAPVLVTVLQSMEQFVTDMGPDPTKWVLNYPGAKLKLIGTVGLQLPALATAEGAVAQAAANSLFGGWIKDLQALQNPPA
jgi:hypothetical protein